MAFRICVTSLIGAPKGSTSQGSVPISTRERALRLTCVRVEPAGPAGPAPSPRATKEYTTCLATDARSQRHDDTTVKLRGGRDPSLHGRGGGLKWGSGGK